MIFLQFLIFFCEEKKNVMHLPPFHKDTVVGLLSALASQNRSQNISRISGSADTNTQKVGGRCYADITTQGTEGVNPSRGIDRYSIRNFSTGNSVHILVGQLQ